MFHRPCRFFCHEACGAAATHILVFVAAVAVARHRRDQACRNVHLAHAVVHRVGDVKIFLLIDHHGLRRMEHGSDRWLVVTVVAVPAHTGYCRDDAAFPVHREPDDIIEAGLERGLPIVKIHGHIQSV